MMYSLDLMTTVLTSVAFAEMSLIIGGLFLNKKSLGRTIPADLDAPLENAGPSHEVALDQAGGVIPRSAKNFGRPGFCSLRRFGKRHAH